MHQHDIYQLCSMSQSMCEEWTVCFKSLIPTVLSCRSWGWLGQAEHQSGLPLSPAHPYRHRLRLQLQGRDLHPGGLLISGRLLQMPGGSCVWAVRTVVTQQRMLALAFINTGIQNNKTVHSKTGYLLTQRTHNEHFIVWLFIKQHITLCQRLVEESMSYTFTSTTAFANKYTDKSLLLELKIPVSL